MKYTVYKTTNKLNGKVYIGKHQTDNLDDDYMGSGKMLQHAFKKHGIENFTKEILFVFDTEEEMNAKESELVSLEFCSEDTNYNLCPGGQGGWGYINSGPLRNGLEKTWSLHKEIFLANLVKGRETQKILKQDKEYSDKIKRKCSESLKKTFSENGHHWVGRTHSIETKQKIGLINSVKQSGNKNSQFGSMWITNGFETKKIKKLDTIPDGWYKGRN